MRDHYTQRQLEAAYTLDLVRDGFPVPEQDILRALFVLGDFVAPSVFSLGERVAA